MSDDEFKVTKAGEEPVIISMGDLWHEEKAAYRGHVSTPAPYPPDTPFPISRKVHEINTLLISRDGEVDEEATRVERERRRQSLEATVRDVGLQGYRWDPEGYGMYRPLHRVGRRPPLTHASLGHGRAYPGSTIR